MQTVFTEIPKMLPDVSDIFSGSSQPLFVAGSRTLRVASDAETKLAVIGGRVGVKGLPAGVNLGKFSMSYFFVKFLTSRPLS